MFLDFYDAERGNNFCQILLHEPICQQDFDWRENDEFKQQLSILLMIIQVYTQ